MISGMDQLIAIEAAIGLVLMVLVAPVYARHMCKQYHPDADRDPLGWIGAYWGGSVPTGVDRCLLGLVRYPNDGPGGCG